MTVDFVPGELLIQFLPNAAEEAKAAALASVSATLNQRFDTPARVASGAGEFDLISLPHDSRMQEAIRELVMDPAVAYVEPNWIYTSEHTSNDPYYTNGSLWGTYGVSTTPSNGFGSQAGAAWAGGNIGSATVAVGIIDTGIDFNHPDLAANIWTNPNEIPTMESTTTPTATSTTFTAGTSLTTTTRSSMAPLPMGLTATVRTWLARSAA